MAKFPRGRRNKHGDKKGYFPEPKPWREANQEVVAKQERKAKRRENRKVKLTPSCQPNNDKLLDKPRRGYSKGRIPE